MGLWKKLFGGGNPDRDEFAGMVTARIKELFPQKKVVYHPGEEFCLEIEGLSDFYLSNLYRDYCNAARDRKPHTIDYYLSAFSDIEKQKSIEYFEVERDRFFPHIRPAAFFSIARLQLKARKVKDPLDMPCRPFAGDLVVSLVIDSPTSISSVTAKSLEDWKRTFAEVEAAAMENLFRSTPGKLELSDGIYAAPWADVHNGSRLLLPHLFEDLRLEGDVVAFVPTRETLFVTGSRNEKALQAFPKLSERAMAAGRPLSPAPLVLRDGKWQELALPASHPACEGLLLMKLQQTAGDYEDQGKLLQQIEGDDIYVAKYSVVRSKVTQSILTYCVWSRGVPSILPRTGLVVFARDEKDFTPCRWEDVFQACGEMMVPVGLAPERYRVLSFPEESVLRGLKPAGDL